MIGTDKIPLIFSKHGTELQSTRHAAEKAEETIEAISLIIESHTARVCPDCRSVCCVNRHSRFDYSDVIFMSSLGREIPADDPAVEFTDPCRFLGARGCLRKRSERPYRCTWFFCSPLIEVIEEQMPLAEHRKFMKMLRRITELRTEMIMSFETVLMNIPPSQKHHK
ncbi:MAG: hypothetical protein HZB62_01255 [Nitrospirae bacterium]|nr:hypothetical protein [Nitrospirota bacterium]